MYGFTRKLFMYLTICLIFILSVNIPVSAGGSGQGSGSGETVSGPMQSGRVDPGVARQNIEDEEIRHGDYHPKDYPYDDSLQGGGVIDDDPDDGDDSGDNDDNSDDDSDGQ